MGAIERAKVALFRGGTAFLDRFRQRREFLHEDVVSQEARYRSHVCRRTFIEKNAGFLSKRVVPVVLAEKSQNGKVITKTLNTAFSGSSLFRNGRNVVSAIGDCGKNVQLDRCAQRVGLLVGVQGIKNMLRGRAIRRGRSSH